MATILDQGMPASLDAERAILGAILLDNTAYDQAAAKIKAGDFSLDSHRRLFFRMEELAEEGKPIDFVTLTEQLGQNKEIEAVGGVAYVTSLTDGLPRVKNIDQYVKMVKDKSMLRSTIHICNATVAAAYEQSDSATRILSYHDDAMLQLLGQQAGETKHVSEFSEDVVNNIFAIRAKGQRLAGFSYGIDDLDSKTTGVRRKEFTIIGARPKQGKTVMMTQAAQANCENAISTRGTSEPVGVGLFSVEMNRDALLERIYASVAKIDYTHISEPHLMTDDEARKLLIAKQVVDGWPLFIDDDPEVTGNEICARARVMKKRYNVGLVCVDYLQIVNGTGDMRMRMTKLSRSLRTLARNQDLAVIALSQLSRKKDRNVNAPPEIDDLKESGSLEADANTILLIYRPVYVGGEEDNLGGAKTGMKTGNDEIFITQRRGSPGIAVVTFMGKWQRFENRCMKGF